MAHVAGNRAVTASEDMQIGTGLARPDVYDWPAAVATEVQKAQPNVVVVTFGANDDQDMMAGSRYLVRATPAWQAEYARRVGLIMSEVAGRGRMLVWLEMPPVARTRLEQTDQIIDGILRRPGPGPSGCDPGRPHGRGGPSWHVHHLPAGPVGPDGAGADHRRSAPDARGCGRVLPLLLAAIGTHWRLG